MYIEASIPPTVDRHAITCILEYLSFIRLGAVSPSRAVFPSASGLFSFPRFRVSSFPRFLVSAFPRFLVSAFPRFRVSSFPCFLVSLFSRFLLSSFPVSDSVLFPVLFPLLDSVPQSSILNRLPFRSPFQVPVPVPVSGPVSSSHSGSCSRPRSRSSRQCFSLLLASLPRGVALYRRQRLITDSYLARPRRVRSCGSRPHPVTLCCVSG